MRTADLFSLFAKKGPTAAEPAARARAADCLTPKTGACLLDTPRRRRLLQAVWQRTALSRAQFDDLYRRPIERYAALVQELPASESHHHAYLGGMLDHGIEIVAYAVRLRHTHLLPIGAPPESQTSQSEAWTAAAAYGALLHDIGKIAVDVHVEYEDGAVWHPWNGPPAKPYRFRYKRDRLYRLHSAAAGLLSRAVLSDHILDWLSDFPEALASLLFVLAGQYEHAGVLGDLVRQSDQASVAAALGGDPAKAREAPTHTLQRKLMDGLRYLVREKLRLNQPQASDGWLTQDALWLVSKTVSDKLRAHLLAQGAQGIPNANTVLFDVLQEHGIAQPTPHGKAIWSATVLSASGWTNTFTFLKISPHLIWSDDERPGAFQGEIRTAGDVQTAESERPSVRDSMPASEVNFATSDTLAATVDSSSTHLSVANSITNHPDPPAFQNGSLAALNHDALSPMIDGHEREAAHADTRISIGESFMGWLREGIRTRNLIINDAMALVHTVDGTAYVVTPGIFRRYADENPSAVDIASSDHQLSAWEIVQKAFERLHIHRKQANGLNIWTCQVAGPRRTRRLHGYLLLDGRSAFESIPPNNPYLTLDHTSGMPGRVTD